MVQNDFSIYSSLLLICIHYTFLIEDSSCFYFHLGARSKRISHKMPSSCCFQIHFRWLSRYAWHRCDTSSEHAIDWLQNHCINSLWSIHPSRLSFCIWFESWYSGLGLGCMLWPHCSMLSLCFLHPKSRLASNKRRNCKENLVR